MKTDIRGIQEAQRDNAKMVAAMQPNGGLGRAVQYGTIEGHRYAVAITHVDTGALRGSHRMDVSGAHGRIYIDPASVNPRSGQRPSVYGPYEHARGGPHAFYQRTQDEAWQRVGEAAWIGFRREMP